MDKITGKSETSHALLERLPDVWRDRVGGGRYVARGRTWCGRIVEGRTGATIAPGIDCQACRRSMRANGYEV